MARIGIIGSEGAMGAALISVVQRSDHELSGGIDRGGDPAGLADRSDVLVDFSAPQALEANIHAAIGAGIPLVIGTTGLEARHHLAIDNAARAVPVLQTGNTSLGVTLLAHLVREAAQRLGPDWDIEILEMHHRRKVDAPSGTAILLGEAAAEGRGAGDGVHRHHIVAGHPAGVQFDPRDARAGDLGQLRILRAAMQNGIGRGGPSRHRRQPHPGIANGRRVHTLGTAGDQ